MSPLVRSGQIFGSYFDWVVCFVIVEFLEFFVEDTNMCCTIITHFNNLRELMDLWI